MTDLRLASNIDFELFCNLLGVEPRPMYDPRPEKGYAARGFQKQHSRFDPSQRMQDYVCTTHVWEDFDEIERHYLVTMLIQQVEYMIPPEYRPKVVYSLDNDNRKLIWVYEP